jgi:pyruvate formate lyase activating enzyme
MKPTAESPGYLRDLLECTLCEWRCGVNRLEGELGVCRVGIPQVAARSLHPAPPESYTVFMSGCNFRCLQCQNWEIAHYPDSGGGVEGWIDPESLAEDAVSALRSRRGRAMGADRIFFSGGGPTCSLPWIEETVRHARSARPQTKVNFDTNGFMTPEALQRVLDFTTSITFDLRAHDDEVHRELTGAPVQPVLRNARRVGAHPEKLWEFRIALIPGINEDEVRPLARLIAEINPDLPVSFLAFRPNFVLEEHPGATRSLLEAAVEKARDEGLTSVGWAGRPGLPGEARDEADIDLTSPGARRGAAYSLAAGCATHPRDCAVCSLTHRCPVRGYRARRRS